MPSPRYSESLQSLPLTATRLWDLPLPLQGATHKVIIIVIKANVDSPIPGATHKTKSANEAIVTLLVSGATHKKIVVQEVNIASLRFHA